MAHKSSYHVSPVLNKDAEWRILHTYTVYIITVWWYGVWDILLLAWGNDSADGEVENFPMGSLQYVQTIVALG